VFVDDKDFIDTRIVDKYIRDSSLENGSNTRKKASVFLTSFIISSRLHVICKGVSYRVIKSEEIIFKSLIFIVLLHLCNWF
jgi:hypothetical protein